MNKNLLNAAIACISPETGKCINAPSLTAKIIVAVVGLLAMAFVAWFFFGKKRSETEMEGMTAEEHMNM